MNKLIECYNKMLNKALWQERATIVVTIETVDGRLTPGDSDDLDYLIDCRDAIDKILMIRESNSSDMIARITDRLNKGMEGQFDSRHASHDEVNTAWLLCEIQELRAEIKFLKEGG